MRDFRCRVALVAAVAASVHARDDGRANAPPLCLLHFLGMMTCEGQKLQGGVLAVGSDNVRFRVHQVWTRCFARMRSTARRRAGGSSHCLATAARHERDGKGGDGQQEPRRKTLGEGSHARVQGLTRRFCARRASSSVLLFCRFSSLSNRPASYSLCCFNRACGCRSCLAMVYAGYLRRTFAKSP